MKANALGLTGVMWLWIASGCGQGDLKRNPPDANAGGSSADTRLAGGAGGYLAGTGGYLAGTGGATSAGGTTAAVGGAAGQGGAPRLDAGAADGKDAGQDISVVEQEAGRDAGAWDIGADGGSPLVCNGSLLPGGLPTTRTGGSPVTAVAGDLNGDGKLDLVTAGTPDGVSVLLGQGDGSFAASQTLGGGPWGTWGPSLALADLNGDGHLDLVNVQGPNVRLGKGDGTFAEAVSYPTADPHSITLGDLNGDGYLDIVAANYGAGTVSVLLGKGDGTFAASVDYPAGDSPWVAVIGDLNGDGAPDLVVVASKVMNVLLGKGDGTLGTRMEIQSPIAGTVQVPSAAIGDLNGDGKLDLVLGWGNGLVYILLGKGDGTFGASKDLNFAPGSVLSLLDLNGDGKLDLVTHPGDVNVRFGHGDGSFGAATDYTTGTGASVTFGVLGDFNGDGILDLAVTFGSSQAGWVRVLLGTGGGAFSQTPEYSTGDGVNVNAFVLGDLDGDGVLDIATASEKQHGLPMVSVLRGKGGGTFAAKQDLDTDAAKAIALGDLNGDGRLDVVTSQVSVLLNHGDGTFTLKDDYQNPAYPVSLALGDLDGDGKLDIVTANGGSNPLSSISVLLGKGDGTFAPHAEYATSSLSDAVALGDLNRDGKLDVVVANHGGDSTTQSVSVLLGQGEGTFVAKVDYPFQYLPLSEYLRISLALGDLNGDGALDIIWGPDTNNVGVLLGKGDGTFADSVSYLVQDGAASLALGDVNRDGKPDLVAITRSGGTLCLLLGKGDGSFADTIYYPAASSLLALADLNADGKLEVIAYSYPEIFVLNLCH